MLALKKLDYFMILVKFKKPLPSLRCLAPRVSIYLSNPPLSIEPRHHADITLPLPLRSVPSAAAHEATLLNGSAKRDGRFAAEGRRVTLQNYPGFRVE